MAKIISTTETARSAPVVPRRTAWVGVVVLVIVVAAGAAWFMLMPRTTRDRTKVSDNPPPTKIVIKSSAALNEQLGTTEDAAKKAAIYRDMATAYQKENNLPAAIDAMRQVITLRQTADDYILLGGLYERAGDKAGALDMYKKALALLTPTKDPDANTPYNDIAGRIKRLGGS